MGPTHLVLLDVKHSGALLDVQDSKTMFDINLSSLTSRRLCNLLDTILLDVKKIQMSWPNHHASLPVLHDILFSVPFEMDQERNDVRKLLKKEKDVAAINGH